MMSDNETWRWDPNRRVDPNSELVSRAIRVICPLPDEEAPCRDYVTWSVYACCQAKECAKECDSNELYGFRVIKSDYGILATNGSWCGF
jgi:hypothetical protein